MREEVCFSSSLSHHAQLAGAAQYPWNVTSECVRETQYARGRPAHAQKRSVQCRACRVYGCCVLARGQKTIYADAWRVHGCGVLAWRTESYRHRYNLEAGGKRVGESVNRRIIIN